MNKLVNTFDIDLNFWEANPQFKIALSFKDLYKRDRSRGKKDSSDMMWGIAYVYDPSSLFYNMPIKEKQEVIGEDFMKDIDYFSKHKSKLEPLINDYIKLIDSPIDRHLRQWTLSLDDRTTFLSTVKYDLDNFDKLDKMAANTKAVFDTFKKIQEDREKEAAGGGTVKGGGLESLNDTGEI